MLASLICICFCNVSTGRQRAKDTFVNLIGETKVSRINSVTRPKVLIDVLLRYFALSWDFASLFPWKYSVIRKYRVHVYIASSNTPCRNKSRFTERYRAARKLFAANSGLIEGQRLRNDTHRIQGVPPPSPLLIVASLETSEGAFYQFFSSLLLHASPSRCSHQPCLSSTHQDHYIARVFVTRGRSRH